MNVLITGANGFIGSNLMTLLSDVPNIKLFAGTRDTVNLLSLDSLMTYIKTNKIDKIVHCAVSGRGLATETSEDAYKNILMFENLLCAQNREHILINIGSGAEFDRTKNINKETESMVLYRMPTDYYGFAKNVIAKNMLVFPNSISLRLFGCFYHNELSSRLIHKCLTNYIAKKPIVISQDKYMDFFYMEDLAIVIKKLLTKSEHYPATYNYKDMNMSYLSTPKLSSIVNCINNLDDHKVEVIIENSGMGNSYSGDGKKLADLNLPLKGLETGIKECYERLKH